MNVKLRLLPAALLLALLAAGCDSGNPGGPPQSFVTPLLGTYSGTRVVTEGSRPPTTENVTITITQDPARASVRLTLTSGSGTPEVTEGVYNDREIRLGGSADGIQIEFVVDRNGNVTGSGQLARPDGLRGTITVTGSMTPRAIALDLDTRITQGVTGTPTGQLNTTRIRASR
ncbi:MAG: hypothetical protein ACK41D_01770 [Rubricoccaceae bacterium]